MTISNDAMSLASMGFTLLLVIIGLIAWFFVNRASVRASQQVRLLESLLEEQKRQNVMLHRLTEAVAGKEKAASTGERDSQDFIRLIPER
ncbi:YebO family protein [Pantoea sp. FN060301]|uniref:YebO family protein n=1 Tax=Pantoea sp. FN060301 TaxID=3420380 RepID=UPI003D176891